MTAAVEHDAGSGAGFRVLLVGGSGRDAALVRRELRKVGLDLDLAQVEAEAGLRGALERDECDLVLLAAGGSRASLERAAGLCRVSGAGVPLALLAGDEGTAAVLDAIRAGIRRFAIEPDLGDLAGLVREELALVDEGRRRDTALAGFRADAEQLRRLVESSPDVVYRYRLLPEPGYEYVSPAVSEVVGYTPEECYADPELAWAILHPDDRHVLEQLRGHTEPRMFAVRWLHRDGSIVWTEQHQRPVLDEDGQLVAVEGVARDITPQVLAEQELRRANEELAILQETALSLIEERDARRVLEQIAVAASRLLDSPGVAVGLLEADGRVTFEIVTGRAQPFQGMSFRPSPKFLGRVLAEQRTVAIDDYQLLRERVAAFAEAGVRAAAATPLVSGADLVGVLCVTRDEEGRRYTGREIELLERLGRLASLALSSARLNEQLDQRTAELGALLEREQAARGAFEAIIEASPLAIVAVDNDKRVTTWNRAAEALFGWSAAEVVGGPAPHVPAEEVEHVAAALQALEAGETVTDVETTRRRKDGRAVEVSMSFAALPAADGRVEGFMSLALDITERKRIERELRRSRERLALALEAADMGVWERIGTIDPVWSPELERLFGLEPGAFSGRHEDFLTLVHPDDRERVDRAIREALLSGAELALEYRVLGADGEVRWFLSRGKPLGGEQGSRHLIGIAVDITPQKRALAAVEAALHELERADRDRRQLLRQLVRAQEDERQRIASDIHDDSVQVLTALALRLDLLGEQVGADARPALAEAARTARRSIERLRHLIFELRPPALDRDGLVPALRALLSQVEAEHGLVCKLHDRLETEPEPAARAILFRIVQEAIHNVVKHARAGSLTVALGQHGPLYRATVTDDGAGFDVAAFQDVPGHLGIVSMRERAEMAGGDFTIRSQPGRGTTVEVSIPATAAI